MKINNLFFIALAILFLVPNCLAEYEEAVKAGTASLTVNNNILSISLDSRISMIIPAIMLIISLVSVAIDFGVVGITASCMVSLFLLAIVGVIAIEWTSITALTILAIILIFKVSQ